MRYSAIRVALPRHNTSTPVAAGSSVPVWPTLCNPSSVRARATTSWDVRPAGLLMTSTPSKATPAWRSVRSRFTMVVLRLGRLWLYLIQQGHHSLHPIERGILDKRQRGDVPQLQAPPQLASDEPLGPRQHRQRLRLLRALLQDRHIDPGLPQIHCYVHGRHGHEADPRIFDPPHQDIGDLHADLIAHPVCALVACHGSKQLHVVLDQLDGRIRADLADDRVQHLARMAAIIRHTGHAQHRALPEVVPVHLGDGDIVRLLDTVFQAQEYLALAFERADSRQVQINRTDANDHRAGRSELRGDLVDGKDLEPVAGLDIVEILHSDTALVPSLHLFHIVLEAADAG